MRALQRQVDGLREAMASRAVIEQAKGIVMVCHGVSPDQAFGVLVRWSSLGNIKLRDVAATLVGLDVRDQPLGDAKQALARAMAEAIRQRTPAVGSDGRRASQRSGGDTSCPPPRDSPKATSGSRSGTPGTADGRDAQAIADDFADGRRHMAATLDAFLHNEDY